MCVCVCTNVSTFTYNLPAAAFAGGECLNELKFK